MKALFIVDIPDDYQEYGDGDWYVVGDDLRIVYEEDGALMTYEYIDDDIAELKPMPKKKDVFEECMKLDMCGGIVSEEIVYQVRGYNYCVDELLGEEK